MMPLFKTPLMLIALSTLLASMGTAGECPGDAIDEVCESIEAVADEQGLFDPAMVWSPTVEQLDWSEIQPQYSDKPWLGSAQNIGPDQVVVKGVAGSKKSAIALAISEQILPRLANQLTLDAPWRKRSATHRVRRELDRRPIIVDQFQQTFYKTIDEEKHEVFTRDAILLDLSSQQMQHIMRSVRRDLQRGEQVRFGAFSFAAIVISIAAIACWAGSTFLNRVTQGYYIWPIRLTATVIMLGTCGMAAGITHSILQTL